MNGGGGLLCVWHREFLQQNLVVKGERLICVKGFIKEFELWCAISLVYGAHFTSKRKVLWKELLDIEEKFSVPFFMMRDFTEVLTVRERSGSFAVTRNVIKFGNWTNDMNLVDLSIVGKKFT